MQIEAQKTVKPLQYAACRPIPTFCFQTNLFRFGKFLEAIYLHVLLSKGKEGIMNDLSIVLPLLVEARASAGARHVRGARSAGPHTRPHHGLPLTDPLRSFVFLRATAEFGGFLTDGQRSHFQAGMKARQSAARRYLPSGRPIVFVVPKAAAAASRRPPPSARTISHNSTVQ